MNKIEAEMSKILKLKKASKRKKKRIIRKMIAKTIVESSSVANRRPLLMLNADQMFLLCYDRKHFICMKTLPVST